MEKDYLLMRSHLGEKENFKLDELSNIWHCSIRTVRRKLIKYSNENKISFSSGNGRGNLSAIHFKKTFYDDFNNNVRTALKFKNYDDLAFLLQLDFPEEWILPYLEEINSLFKVVQQDAYQTCFKGLFSRSISSLDPLKISSAIEAFILSHVGNTLFLFNKETNEIEPNIAHHWVYSSETQKWIFYIRRGIRFHNGQNLTAFDIAYSLNRIIKSKSNHWLFSQIVEINVQEPFVLSLKTAENSCVDILRLLSTLTTTIVPKNYMNFEDAFIGSGPFMIDVISDKKVVLKTFDSYFGYRPMIDKAEFWILENKAIDSFLIHRDHRLKVEDGFSYLVFNHNQPIFKNENNRKAISSLFNDYPITYPKHGYFETQARHEKTTEKLNFTYNGYLTLGFLDNSDAKEEAYKIKKFLEKKSIKVSLLCIFKKDFFNKMHVFEKIDLLLAGELSSEDQELSFLNFILDDNLPNKSLLPQDLFLFVRDLSNKETFKNLNHFTRILDQRLVDNAHLIYLEKKIRDHTLFDMLLLDNVKNAYGFICLNDLWIVD